MSFVDCTRTDLSDGDILRSVLSYDTVNEHALLNVVVGVGSTCFFDCINKGRTLSDALRASAVLVGTNLYININTL